MGQALEPRELYSRQQAAAFLSLSEQTLKGWAARGVGPAFSRSGPVRGRVWYQRADLLAWLEAQKRRPAVAAAVGGENNRGTPPRGGEE